MIAPARRVSYRILLQISTSDAHSDELLRSPEVDALSAQDRNLATTLVMGTLRWQLALDVRIRAWLARPDANLSPEAATALRMGTYQLLALERVPAHAVIHDSVELVKHSRERGAAGMVNAVLRKITAEPRWGGEGAPVAETEESRRSPGAALAARFAHPAWMVERWVRRYGIEAAEAICRWDQQPAGVTIRLAHEAAQPEGIETEPGIFLRPAQRVIGGDAARTRAFRSGEIRMQDEASQLVAEIAAAAGPEAERALDACAAPGGKTAILAERLPEAEITAVDVSRKRLAAMQRMLRRGPGHQAGVEKASRMRFEAADAVALRLTPRYGLILCDVPCSGTGTIARNPEIRFRLDEVELRRQHKRQTAILRAALPGLVPGGRLVYSTCSLEPEENEQVVEEVLSSIAGFRLLPVATILDKLAGSGIVTAPGRERLRTATDASFLRTLPGMHPCDGFFAAVLERA